MKTKHVLILAAIVLTMLVIPDAWAAQTSTAPWNTGFTNLKTELTGPIPFIIGLVAMAGSLGVFIMARHELSGLMQILLALVFVVGILFNGVAALACMGGTAAML